MAEQLSIFGMVVGVALLLTGVGLVILAFAVFGREPEAAAQRAPIIDPAGDRLIRGNGRPGIDGGLRPPGAREGRRRRPSRYPYLPAPSIGGAPSPPLVPEQGLTRRKEDEMKVREIMTTDVLTIGPEAELRDVARLFVDHGISGLPVCGAQRKILGVISEGDILFKEHGRANEGQSLLARLRTGARRRRPTRPLRSRSARL